MSVTWGSISTLPSAIVPLLCSPLQKHCKIVNPLQSGVASVVGWTTATQWYQDEPINVNIQGKGVFTDVIKLGTLTWEDYTGGEAWHPIIFLYKSQAEGNLIHAEEKVMATEAEIGGLGATTSRWMLADTGSWKRQFRDFRGGVACWYLYFSLVKPMLNLWSSELTKNTTTNCGCLLRQPWETSQVPF